MTAKEIKDFIEAHAMTFEAAAMWQIALQLAEIKGILRAVTTDGFVYVKAKGTP